MDRLWIYLVLFWTKVYADFHHENDDNTERQGDHHGWHGEVYLNRVSWSVARKPQKNIWRFLGGESSQGQSSQQTQFKNSEQIIRNVLGVLLISGETFLLFVDLFGPFRAPGLWKSSPGWNSAHFGGRRDKGYVIYHRNRFSDDVVLGTL